MGNIKKYGFHIVISFAIILFIVNVVNVFSTNTVFQEIKSQASMSKEYNKEVKNDIKLKEEALKEAKEKQNELEQELTGVTEESDAYWEENEKLGKRLVELKEEKDKMISLNLKNYELAEKKELTEELLYQSLEIAKDSKVVRKDFQAILDDSKEVGILQKDEEVYIVAVFRQYLTVSSLDNEKRLKHIHIVNPEKNEVVAEKSYSALQFK